MRLHRPSPGLFLLLLGACDPGDVALLAPDQNGGETPPVPIHAVVDAEYAELSASLAWGGGVPGARVRIHRLDEPYGDDYWRTTEADSMGVASFADVLGGLYEIVVRRTLTAAESTATHGAVWMLAGGRRIRLPTSDVTEVSVAPDSRGSLVLAETKFNQAAYPSETGGISYSDGKYFEVFNNSDTTVYLDGKLWGVGWEINVEQTLWPCAQTAVVRNDPEGIWAQRILRFPGSGTEHPLPPGQVALIAKVAIDHRSVHPALDDLRGADFEWGGSADNPDVPNLQDIGLRPMVTNWPWDGYPVFLSEAADLTTLPRYVDPVSGYVWVRIPRALLLDVTVATYDQATAPSSGGQATVCLEAAHRYFERLPGPAAAFADFYDGLSLQRRGLRTLPDGRKVLQDTDTSMEDFVKAPRTPGWIPASLP